MLPGRSRVLSETRPMAKQTPNRSSAEDSGAAAPAQPKPRRQKATLPAVPDAGIQSEAGDDAPLQSMSMASEPSEEDIRMRAYHRYLERGGSHGMDFQDWLEAEREVRERK